MLDLKLPLLYFHLMENCKLSDFTIKKQLGRGGFGSAYLAVHNTDKKEVCLKFIPLYGGSATKSALDEAKTLSQLEDVHIIKYYGSFVEENQFCIVMEYAAKGTLYDEIEVSNLFLFEFCLFLSFLFISRIVDAAE